MRKKGVIYWKGRVVMQEDDDRGYVAEGKVLGKSRREGESGYGVEERDSSLGQESLWC